MATTTKRRTPSKKSTKAAGTPAAEPTSAETGAPTRTDVSAGGAGTEGPSAGSANARQPEAAASTDDAELHEAIARRAYEIYEANGRPEGRDAEHWAQAEQEIRARRAAGRA